MTAFAPILPGDTAEPEDFDAFTDILPDPAPRRARDDGWTPDRQRRFLSLLAEGHTVTRACAALGMSASSAYALRRSAAGAAFALGWQAAHLLARDHLADKLLERAVHGVTETVTRADGSTVTRQRQDNRLAMHLLTRLDRLADSATGAADHAAARLVAGDFDQYLDLVEREAGPARTGLFLARRLGAEAGADDLAPVRALARADAWLRTGQDGAAPVPVDDLDPARRAHWTAEQWTRAEAAGLLVLAPPPPEPAHERELCELSASEAPPPGLEPVWWDYESDAWRTCFAPPEDFDGEEDGEFGDFDYTRSLTPAEAAVMDAQERALQQAHMPVDAATRDRYFGFAAPAEEGEAAPEPESEPQPQPEPRSEPEGQPAPVPLASCGAVAIVPA